MAAGERWVVLGLARARSPWLEEISQWATSGVLPLEFLKCLSAGELAGRLDGGRAYSAVLVDAHSTGVDRDLLDAARRAGTAAIVVTDGPGAQRWTALGAAAVLAYPFTSSDLFDVLADHATPVSTTASPTESDAQDLDADPTRWQGRLITVIGRGGTGVSTMAIAVAAHAAGRPGFAGSVALVDGALDADQAMYHDIGDVMPGLSELVEAHRMGRTDRDATRALLFDVEARGYHLLLGLRRRRDWTALTPRAVAESLTSLRATYETVVVDVNADLDGYDTTGSADVEERNLMARHCVRSADAVACVGGCDLRGVRGLVRTISDVLEMGVEPGRIVPVLNRAPARRAARIDSTKALVSLLRTVIDPDTLALSPLAIREVAGLETRHRDVGSVPARLLEVGKAADTVLVAKPAMANAALVPG